MPSIERLKIKHYSINTKIEKSLSPNKIFDELIGYLENILTSAVEFSYIIEDLYDFLEISLLNIENNRKFFKQGFVMKCGGGRYKENKCMVCFGAICKRWLKRWLMITEDGVMYSHGPNHNKVRIK